MSQKLRSVLQPHVEAELRRFGWTLGPEFERRYLTDAWVFNLVNALEVVAHERDEASSTTTTERRAPKETNSTMEDDT